MADDVRELVLQISATTSLLQSQLVRAEGQISSFQKTTESKLTRIEKAFGGTGKGALAMGTAFNTAKGYAASFFGALSVGVLVDLTRKSLDFAGSLGETAQSLGVTAKFMQEFRFAAQQNGASLEGADAALAKFSVTIGKALNGTKAQAAAFKALGISLDDLRKGDDAERFELIAEAIAKIPEPAQRAAAAQSIFGKGFREVLPLLEQGREGFRAAAREAREFGLVLSDRQIQDADKAADKIGKLTSALQVKLAATVADNADAIVTMANAIAELANEAGKAIQEVSGLYNIINQRGLKAGAKALFSLTDGGQALRAASTPEGKEALALRRLIDARRAQAETKADRLNGKSVSPERRVKEAQEVIDAAAEALRLRKEREQIRAPAIKGKQNRLGGGVLGAGGVSALAGINLADVLAAAEGGTGAAGGASVSAARPSRLAPLRRDVEFLGNELPEVAAMLDRVDPLAAPEDNFYSRLGIDPKRDADVITEEAQARLDAAFETNQQIAEDYRQRMQDQTQFLAGIFTDLFDGGTDRVWDNFKRAGLQVIAQVAAQFLVSLVGGGGGGFNIGSVFSTAIGSVFGFGGFREGGGPVSAGQAYVVGEKRPELFVPNTNGFIAPRLPSLGGGGASPLNVTINAPGATAETVLAIRREIAAAAPTIVAAATQNTRRTLSRPRI